MKRSTRGERKTVSRKDKESRRRRRRRGTMGEERGRWREGDKGGEEGEFESQI